MQDKFPGTVQVLDRPSLSQEFKKALDRLDARIIPIPNRHPVETIVVRSKEPVQGPKPFCLTIVHGGPHASSVTSFTPGVLACALEGYTVLHWIHRLRREIYPKASWEMRHA
ncbi:hypothetical protein EV363DRAFT_437566 [Boletus edulis]|uniref:Uncharacterized protein n=1 Tax=Boletus edulis BED1 TaxID=1328754 RepID=A0AAD4G782_BOLED|nr:hypothetical protein EV363DRAFT_437566 [Boletus edulis]KAF8425065.1 hypothetical protein L210DRAFT_3224010 [Boletus edulis BED1]